MPPGEERRVFERFRRGRTDRPGTGLGLAIVEALARRWGGSASISTRDGGVGTRAEVVLPLAVVELMRTVLLGLLGLALAVTVGPRRPPGHAEHDLASGRPARARTGARAARRDDDRRDDRARPRRRRESEPRTASTQAPSTQAETETDDDNSGRGRGRGRSGGDSGGNSGPGGGDDD